MEENKRDILMPIRRPWTDQIFSRKKPFEFRHRKGRSWQPGSKLYIYESRANKGAGMVIGDAVIDCIIDIPNNIIGPPRPLLRYWAEHVSANGENLLPLLDELGDYELPNYKKGTILRYLGRPDLMRQAMETGCWVFIDDEGDNPVSACEEWLTEIGLIDEWGTYCYQYALKLKDVWRYLEPLPLAAFGLARAPQSWCYVEEGLV